jgi:hypothetical protein
MENFWSLLSILALVFVGYLLGNFLALHMLVIITIVCIAVTVWMTATLEELESLLTIIFGLCATVINLSMWVTYYFATKQAWVGDFFLRNVLR